MEQAEPQSARDSLSSSFVMNSSSLSRRSVIRVQTVPVIGVSNQYWEEGTRLRTVQELGFSQLGPTIFNIRNSASKRDAGSIILNSWPGKSKFGMMSVNGYHSRI